MKLKYINKIKANISIATSKRTTNILDGTYKSVYKGKSLNFENLREYTLQDDVRDIDWKASVRSRNLLVKQFIATKKHNIMLLVDSGLKMNADTDLFQSKKDIALYTAGTIGYLAISNGDYVGMAYSILDKVIYKPFKYNLYRLEQYLSEYDFHSSQKNNVGLSKTLEYVFQNVSKRMIIFVITDIEGINSISEELLRKINQVHDLLFINIRDNFMFGDDIYDLDESKYIPPFLLQNKKLYMHEQEIRKKLTKENSQKLHKYRNCLVSLSSKREIPQKILELLEAHSYASND